MTLALPTRRDEAWRYSDLEAVASVWPVPAAERIEVAVGERISRVIVQDAEPGAVAIRDFVVVLREGATATFHVLNTGGALGRVTIDVTCHQGSHFELGAAMLGGGEQTLEIVTTLNHVEPEATSNQLVRSVLGGRATGSFLGKVAVARGAQKTDAAQSVKAMLLARTATANAKPELEIFADDVKCAHGATVGELDQRALFYLTSRGIPPAQAKVILLRAFVADAFAGVADAGERARLEAAAEAALERLLNLPLPAREGRGPRGEAGGGRVRARIVADCPHPSAPLALPPSPEGRGTAALDVVADFPAIPPDWAYLDTAATAQKPRPVIDAITRGYAESYATVHRGVYQRSAEMTLAYEAARRRVAGFIGGASGECVFVRGATEGINLVAECWAGPQLKAGDRILLSALEHHSNIVPWQMVAEKAGAAIDVVPLTADQRIDLVAMAGMLSERHKLVALGHVSNVLGSVLDARRAAELAHRVGAKLLLDGCQAVPRMPVNVGAIGCDFYVFSGHKLYGPTGIGVLWGRAELLEAMPPYQGGGSMIDRVSFARTTYAPPPGRFEAGTPHIVGALGLHAAIDYVEGIGLERIHAHETALVRQARDALGRINSVRLFGPEDSAGIVSFTVEGVHPHDVATILDEERVAIRAGHHCAQPLMETLGVEATARASFGVYNSAADVDALVRGLERVSRIFG